MPICRLSCDVTKIRKSLTFARTKEGGVVAHKVFLEFFQGGLLSVHTVFSSCTHLPLKHFDIRLVRIGYCCYGIRHHNLAGGQDLF